MKLLISDSLHELHSTPGRIGTAGIPLLLYSSRALLKYWSQVTICAEPLVFSQSLCDSSPTCQDVYCPQIAPSKRACERVRARCHVRDGLVFTGYAHHHCHPSLQHLSHAGSPVPTIKVNCRLKINMNYKYKCFNIISALSFFMNIYIYIYGQKWPGQEMEEGKCKNWCCV